MFDSLHMLLVMPRRLGTHRSAWISQQPRLSERRMSTSAKLVLSWCQGVGGRSEFGAACQGAGGSLNMWSTMLTRQSTYHLPPIWRALRPSQPRMRNSAKLVSSLRQGVGGLSEVGTAGQGASGSLDMW